MHMKKKGVRFLAGIIACMVLAQAAGPVRAANISELEQQKKELEKQKKEVDERKKQEQQNYNKASGKVNAIQSDADAVGEEIDEIDAALVETLASVELIEEDIEKKEGQIAQTTEELEEATETEKEQYKAMKLRIQFMYEKGETTYLQLLLESQGFADMVNKVEYIEKLYEYDRALLEQAARQRG